ncbi:hypothetical protein KKG31_05725 [Patescibacteria group bacterium]|nr:hypothetical protein [Patescibacteria group bacterium]MBU1758604.1 hypothetical protein [Patescibacteria group bacterium]
MANDSVNYSQYTHKRISKLKHLSEEQKAELLKEMTLSDYELKNKKSVDKEKKSSTSKDASDYLEYYDNKLNKKEETFKYNEK